jgi:hypothetical protein
VGDCCDFVSLADSLGAISRLVALISVRQNSLKKPTVRSVFFAFMQIPPPVAFCIYNGAFCIAKSRASI